MSKVSGLTIIVYKLHKELKQILKPYMSLITYSSQRFAHHEKLKFAISCMAINTHVQV